MPTSRQRATRISTGTFIQRGRLMGGLGQIDGLAVEEDIVDEAQRIGHGEDAGQGHRRRQRPSRRALRASRRTVSAKNISLDRKPLSSGTPAMAAEATMASAPV